MKVTFIRHTSVAVPRGMCYGHTDVELAETFPQEAEKVAERLKYRSFDRIFTSPLSRCRKLATYCGFPDAIPDPRIIEMNFGEWEMQDFNEIKDPRLQEWFDDYMNVAPTGGESAMQQRSRFIDFIESLRSEIPSITNVAVFTHGGILVHALNIFTSQDYDSIFRNIPPFGSIIELTI
ncbi:MAG: alpha-ribazole phosphatase family protein [Muribaculaceae bacterium]|nr:alpha-ribazole phosphatase family protein [Muribaculaceae bacterium]